MSNLQMSLKKKWFEMTKAGIKTEDYREINEYWFRRLFVNINKWSNDPSMIIYYMKNGHLNLNFNSLVERKEFKINTMTLGYPKSGDAERILKLEHKGIEIREGNPEWGAEPGKLYFVIKHGAILES